MKIAFTKYQGTGNDFILIDNREKNINLGQKDIEKLCNRKFGIGGDGLMLLEKEPGFDFKMVYFNADGRESSMCGNGGRCIVRFAHDLGMKKSEYTFLATDGPHEATIELNGTIRLKMKDVDFIENHTTFDYVNTGSPHIVKMVNDLTDFDVRKEGSSIRNSQKFIKEGVNVNFLEVVNDSRIFVRTFERGVEDETLSCGTGVTACALVQAHNERGFNHIEVGTLGGKLAVQFDRIGEHQFENIWLIGPATKVFEGILDTCTFEK